jgi:cobalt-zinc-cadmium resistance protein CzcA
MLQTASQQYIQGEIDYLQFATIANQTLSIKSSNAEAEFNYYNSIIVLNAITNP